jgi:hypothetical protein
LTNEFTWSVSRQRLFRTCRRAYYFRYYGAWGWWEPGADPLTRELGILKNLKTRFTLAGEVVHETIAHVLGRHRDGQEVPLALAQERVVALLREGFRQSLRQEYRQRKAVGLFEHEYGEEVPPDEWARMRDRALRCLENFYNSEIRRAILARPPASWFPIDTLDSFDFEGTKVFAAPDFAMRDAAGDTHILDWKTGEPDEAAGQRQLACYGLFARERWGLDPRRAVGELCYLESGKHVSTPLDEAALAGAAALIRQSISEMKCLLSDPARNRADPTRFPRADGLSACGRCNFRRICWPEWPPPEAARSSGSTP